MSLYIIPGVLFKVVHKVLFMVIYEVVHKVVFMVIYEVVHKVIHTVLHKVIFEVIFLVVLLCHCRFDILILDEPTFGLGWDQKVKLRSFLRECMSQMHFIVVSHDIKFVRSICDKIIDLDQLSLENNNIGTKEKTKSKRSHNK